jgi:hypothetical protein
LGPEGSREAAVFLTRLSVRHRAGHSWVLTEPLVWQGKWELVVIQEGFETDFASVPKLVRWVIDKSGANSEAAVLHDALWKESQRPDSPRIDPAHADGAFRRALRETGSSALTRGLMWAAVRITAIAGGRFGRGRRLRDTLQLAALAVIFVPAALLPTIVAGIGLVVYWLIDLVVATVWRLVEHRRFPGFRGNWPWPLRRKEGDGSEDDDDGDPLALVHFVPESDPADPELRAAIVDRRIDPDRCAEILVGRDAMATPSVGVGPV